MPIDESEIDYIEKQQNDKKIIDSLESIVSNMEKSSGNASIEKSIASLGHIIKSVKTTDNTSVLIKGFESIASKLESKGDDPALMKNITLLLKEMVSSNLKYLKSKDDSKVLLSSVMTEFKGLKELMKANQEAEWSLTITQRDYQDNIKKIKMKRIK